jgi:hypothetical protein
VVTIGVPMPPDGLMIMLDLRDMVREEVAQIH